MSTKLLDRSAPCTALRPSSRPSDRLVLLALRELEADGPLTGLEIVNRTAALARRLEAPAPGYRLLHDLADDGLLEVSGGRPPEYRITEAGLAEARSLAARCWPPIRDELLRVTRLLGPENDGGFVTAWAEEPAEGRSIEHRADSPPSAA